MYIASRCNKFTDSPRCEAVGNDQHDGGGGIFSTQLTGERNSSGFRDASLVKKIARIRTGREANGNCEKQKTGGSRSIYGGKSDPQRSGIVQETGCKR
jgi:hypothetical protein